TPARVLENFGDLLVTVPQNVLGKKRVMVAAGGQSVEVDVVGVAPAVLIANRAGVGQAAALNEDSTVNGLRSPAAPGSVVSMYVTGMDGKPGVYFGARSAEVLFAGQAPGLAAGVQQINFRVP